jgi:hypothetical protein
MGPRLGRQGVGPRVVPPWVERCVDHRGKTGIGYPAAPALGLSF